MLLQAFPYLSVVLNDIINVASLQLPVLSKRLGADEQEINTLRWINKSTIMNITLIGMYSKIYLVSYITEYV